MLTELTPEQEALMDTVVEEYISRLQNFPPFDEQAVKKWLATVYEQFYNSAIPEIKVVDSPYAACKLASKLTGQTQSTTDHCAFGELDWVAEYDYYLRIGVLSQEETADLLAFRNFALCVWDTLLLDELAIVVRHPTHLSLDAQGNIHSDTGPAIEWADGEKDWCWHSTWVPERMIISPRSYSREEYLALTNTEQRRALCEIAGWDWLAELLGATTVDTWIDPSTNLKYELLRCDDGVQLLRKQSPALADGTQPLYVEPVHEDLRTAQAARKWQATDWTPDRCETNPTLTYLVET